MRTFASAWDSRALRRRRGSVLRFRKAAALGLLAAATCAMGTTPAQAADPLEKVLVFAKTAGFRHDSIPQGIAAVQKLGTENGFTVTATEDATAFTDANLAQYDVIVFMSTTGDILNTDSRARSSATCTT